MAELPTGDANRHGTSTGAESGGRRRTTESLGKTLDLATGGLPRGDVVVETRRALADELRAMRMLVANPEVTANQGGVRTAGTEVEYFLMNPKTGGMVHAGEIVYAAANGLIPDGQPLVHTPEIGRGQVEFGSVPIFVGGSWLSDLARQQNTSLAQAAEAAKGCGAEPVLIGTLLTVRPEDVDNKEKMFKKDRYDQLRAAATELRGGSSFEVTDPNGDRFTVEEMYGVALGCAYQSHACLGSMADVHESYNMVLACQALGTAVCVNAPGLFGKIRWMDSRVHTLIESTCPERVAFAGDPETASYLNGVMDAFSFLNRSDYQPLLLATARERSMDMVEAIIRDGSGAPPEFPVASLQNSTVWALIARMRWGHLDGRPQVRWESRALSAGPTVADQVGATAFTVGLVVGMMEFSRNQQGRMPVTFKQANDNFFEAVRLGLDAEIDWMGVRQNVRGVVQRVLPIARRGLEILGTDEDDIKNYLETVIGSRILRNQTGASYVVQSLRELGFSNELPENVRYKMLAEVQLHYHAMAKTGQPVGLWPKMK